jgi:hypothetical protein
MPEERGRGGFGRGFGGRGEGGRGDGRGRGRGDRGRGRGRGRKDDEEKWVPCTKLGRLVNKVAISMANALAVACADGRIRHTLQL